MTTGHEDSDDTLQERERASARRASVPRTFVFVALEADRPWAGGARFALDDVDEVVVLRAPERGATRAATSPRTLELRLHGRAVSGRHARLSRSADGWTLEDAQSTNGCYVNGKRIETALLRPGDVLEIGRNFLRVETLPAGAETPDALDSRDGTADLPGFVTLEPALGLRLADLRRVAPSLIPLLLTGETGTGKEVLSRAVHAASGRTQDFLAVNCGALTEGLAEAQLFGHVRGAFSGAVNDAPGFVRSADGGTLLLDEVQELRPSEQAALLRVLQEREVVPVGGVRALPVNVRFMAASSIPLEFAAQKGQFRPDLFARLSGFSCVLPPLRQRSMDLGVLVAALLEKVGITEKDGARLHPELVQRLFSHDWPLNVRELEQLLRRAWLLKHDGVIDDETFPPSAEPPKDVPPELRVTRKRALSADDRELRARLVQALEASEGNVAAAARALGKAPMQVRRWAERFSLDLERFRRSD